MTNFISVFFNCLVGVIAFFLAVTVIAIIWYVVLPLIAFMVIKIFNYFNKLSDKAFKKIKNK